MYTTTWTLRAIVIVHELLVHGHCSESGLHSLPSRSFRCPRLHLPSKIYKMVLSLVQEKNTIMLVQHQAFSDCLVRLIYRDLWTKRSKITVCNYKVFCQNPSIKLQKCIPALLYTRVVPTVARFFLLIAPLLAKLIIWRLFIAVYHWASASV